MKYDVGVIGGGAIGLACAWRMARRGARVAVFERGEIGREASWAAAGMLAAQCEAAHHPPLQSAPAGKAGVTHEYSCGASGELSGSAAMFDLCLHSRALYAAFADELFDVTGIDVELSLSNHARGDWRTPGVLYVATRSDDNAPQSLETQKALGHQVEKRAFRGQSALWLCDEGQVNNRVLVEALRCAALNAGVAIYHGEAVRLWPEALRDLDLRDSKRRLHCNIHSIHFGDQRFDVDKTLLCAGAWSKAVVSALSIPTRPIAGEMLSLGAGHRVKHIVYGSDVYLVPRRDKSVLVGATMKKDGFRKRVTPRGVMHLLKAACELVPELENCAILDQWAGIRPASIDGLPMLGRTEMDDLFVATGHFRNGILLAPATAEIMADCVLEGRDAPAAFSLARFQNLVATEPN